MTTTTTIAALKLGKLPVRTDVRTLRLARYVDTAALPPPPATLDLTAHLAEWPMYANDRIGDCTIAAAGHMIEAWSATARGHAAEISERAVLSAFDHVKIVDPRTGDAGAVELDVLKYWRTEGIGRHTIGAFARLAVHDTALVRTGAFLFGGLYIGVALPLTAQSQTVWDWTGSLSGPALPGSWGGHAVNVVGYDEDAVTVVTWGSLKRMSWAFWTRYVDEAYVVLSPDFLRRDHAPNGFDLEQLRADLALISA
jgi:hypothetical protein